MDINTVATARHIDDEEASNAASCCAEAAENGFSPAQADLCEDGALNCVACPF